MNFWKNLLITKRLQITLTLSPTWCHWQVCHHLPATEKKIL